jgi:hypothetical protein
MIPGGKTGRRLVLFSEASSCEAMDGSDGAVQVIENLRKSFAGRPTPNKILMGKMIGSLAF